MIYVIGSSNTDMVVRCAHLPTPGETILGGEFICVQGGKGANQAVAAARLGGNTRFVCSVGDDANGKQSVEAYQKDGVDTSFVRVETGGVSGVALILVDAQGENCIAVAPGTNGTLSCDDIDAAMNEVKKGDIVLMQLEIPIATVLYAAITAHKKGAAVIVDPAPVPPEGLSDEIWQHLDFILPNETEAATLTDGCDDPNQTANLLYERGVKNVIITLGSEGCLLHNQNGSTMMKGFSVKAVDSTAAGDAFAGALATSIADGFSLDEGIRFAQKAAAVSVTRVGAQPSLPTRQELEQFTP